jgi:hypothetical protein
MRELVNNPRSPLRSVLLNVPFDEPHKKSADWI